MITSNVTRPCNAYQGSRQKQLRKYEANLSANDSVSPYSSTLFGGDTEKGKHVYENHVAAQCVRCHNAGGKDNQVGPNLTGIGKRTDKNYLLRSLVDPSMDIADGFNVNVIELTNGKSIIGRLKDQTKKTITLISPEGKPQEIAATKIKKITAANTSVMPPMGAILTKHEIRDLIAYLKIL